MSRSPLSRSTTIFGLVALFMRHVVVGAEPVNVTVDDADPSIEYIPSDSWRASSTACSSQCLLVDTNGTFDKTYHTGVHVLIDMDDLSSSSSSTTHTSSSPAPTESEGDDDRDHDADDTEITKKGRSVNRRLDPDDPGFVDTPVTAAFTFNGMVLSFIFPQIGNGCVGTAVYLFCVQPHGPPPSVLAPTTMNLSFTLDNQPLPSYFHNATADGSSGFTPQFNVLALQNLTPSPHVLLVNLGAGSTFVFDYMIYTTEGNGTAAGTGTSVSGSVQTSSGAAS